MNPTNRANLEALYREHMAGGDDPGRALNVDDHLRCFRMLVLQHGRTDRDLAEILGVPVDYVLALRRADREEKGGTG